MPDWGTYYPEITREFGYDPAQDVAAARSLQPLARDRWQEVKARLVGRTATVFACGPSLDAAGPAPAPVVAADGATSRLRELDLVPDIVVTDLDGKPEDLLWAAREGALMVVHAHGDNVDALATLGPRLAHEGTLLGTCQCDPQGLAPLRNLGGFTDGDRAVLLGEAMGAAAVEVVAFEPDRPPSAHSHTFDLATKAAKLAWARRIVEGAQRRGLQVRFRP